MISATWPSGTITPSHPCTHSGKCSLITAPCRHHAGVAAIVPDRAAGAGRAMAAVTGHGSVIGGAQAPVGYACRVGVPRGARPLHPVRRLHLKISLLTAATALALSLAAPVAAHDVRAAGDCIDIACDASLLFAADDSAAGAGDTVAATRYGAWGIDTAGMDRDVPPGADFFRYVSGTRADNTEIPSDKSMYGSFLVLRDLSEAR